MTKQLTYVDLFAGCGGLSVGLRQSGYQLRLAVEKSEMAAETYYHNLIERIRSDREWQIFSSAQSSVIEQAARKLVVKPLSDVLACKPLLEQLADENIDLVAGGPPCQGFSLAGRRNPDDVRNKLAWEFLDFVGATRPKAVLIENVAGMRNGFKKRGSVSRFDELCAALESVGSGYVVQPMLLNAMHFGVPQHRPRVIILGLRADLAKSCGVVASRNVWRSGIFDEVQPIEFPVRPTLVPKATHLGGNVLSVWDAISDLSLDGYALLPDEELTEYAREMRTDESWLSRKVAQYGSSGRLENQEPRKHSDKIRKRFQLYQALAAQEALGPIVSMMGSAVASKAEIAERIQGGEKRVKYPLVAPDGTILAKSNISLAGLLLELATKKHSQRALKWNQPSQTVLSLPDDFVHPAEPRTLTVREMARFQSFPDKFVFRSKVTTGGTKRRTEVPQYTQVGNAVPPKLARAIGSHLKKVLRASIRATSVESVDQPTFQDGFEDVVETIAR